jgi:hypothetical protein
MYQIVIIVINKYYLNTVCASHIWPIPKSLPIALRVEIVVRLNGLLNFDSLDYFALSKRQRCLFHKLGNIPNKLPQEALAEVMPEIRAYLRNLYDNKMATHDGFIFMMLAALPCMFLQEK